MSLIDTTRPGANDPLYQGASVVRKDEADINAVINKEHSDTGAHLYTAPRLIQQNGTSVLNPHLNNLVFDTSLNRIWFYGYDKNGAGPKWIMLPHQPMTSGNLSLSLPTSMAGGTLYTLLNSFNVPGMSSVQPSLYQTLPSGLNTYPTVLYTLSFSGSHTAGAPDYDFTTNSTPDKVTTDYITFTFTPDGTNYYTFALNRVVANGTVTWTGSFVFPVSWNIRNPANWKLYVAVNPSYVYGTSSPTLTIRYSDGIVLTVKGKAVVI